MCGISVILSSKGKGIASILNLNSSIRHRGPDDEGYYSFSFEDGQARSLFGNESMPEAIDKLQLNSGYENEQQNANVLLGHRRLAIRDTSYRAHQPMISNCGEYVIAYNGEVYNADDLRSELIEKGYSFQSASDTEVVLNGYLEWGEDVLSRLNGMFSIVIFDRLDNEVFAARDRFGIKPLYYWISPDGDVAFASEIKQFQSLQGWEARLNGAMAFDRPPSSTVRSNQCLLMQLCPGPTVRTEACA